MRRAVLLVASAVGIGFCAALGVTVSARVFLGQPLETSVESAVRAGVVAAVVFSYVEYARRYLW